MKTVDTRGLLCPQPLIRTREALNGAQPGDRLTVLIDNETALGNVQSYLKELGVTASVSPVPEGWEIVLVVPTALRSGVDIETHCSVPARSDYIVVLKSERMGFGDDELESILLRAFLNALPECDRLPSAIVLYNGGVKLALSGCDTVEALAALEAKGVPVYACGTCLDFYGIKDRIGVGIVSNMFKIIELTAHAGHIVYP